MSYLPYEGLKRIPPFVGRDVLDRHTFPMRDKSKPSPVIEGRLAFSRIANNRTKEAVSMKKPDRYIFPAIFTYETGQEIAVVFPDLNCATSGVDDEDALLSARELLGGRLALLEEDGEEIPAPTPLSEVKVEENERSALVDVFMPSIRMAAVTKSINRTVSLPAWLNAAALEKNVNFSQILQDALKATLGVQAPAAD